MSVDITAVYYAGVKAEIAEISFDHCVILKGIVQRRVRDYVLTPAQVSAAINELETEVRAIDVEAVLAGFRSLKTERPCTAGWRHLSALALADTSTRWMSIYGGGWRPVFVG
jgi:hypothetical protein